MGMDIYFQAFDASGGPVGERQNLRGREIYHLMNRWLDESKRATPSNGEHVSIEASEWEQLRPKVQLAIIEGVAEVEGCIRSQRQPKRGRPREELDVEDVMNEARAAADEWMLRIWPPGASRVEYWFTN